MRKNICGEMFTLGMVVEKLNGAVNEGNIFPTLFLQYLYPYTYIHIFTFINKNISLIWKEMYIVISIIIDVHCVVSGLIFFSY